MTMALAKATAATARNAAAASGAALHGAVLLLRDRVRLEQLYGPQSLDEEIETETQLAREREHAEGAAR